MTGYVTVFNPTSTPQPLDDAGRTVGGGEWDVAHAGAELVKDGLDAGRLTKVDVSKADDADVRALDGRAAELNSRAASFTKAGVEDLRDTYVELYPDDAEARRVAVAAGKAELVHELTLNPDAVPPAAPVKE